uniref:N-acetyltransferase domain-containing protein n=1 Tax=Globisporangium ultimum (strain ATCC 200006 / CBS 805.95 / DAOM BR144) TaxID=431595 RepID=K3WRJ0_GLOUD
MTLLVTRVTTAEEKKIALALRYKVFIDEQGFDPSVEIDAYDDKDTTLHFLGKDVEQDKYVAVARVLLDPTSRKAKIGRVAVLSECRGKNYGVALMDGLEQDIADLVDLYALSAQYDKKGFYEKCGYSYTTGEVYMEEGVEHCMMTKKTVKRVET